MLGYRRPSIEQRGMHMRQRDVQCGRALHIQLEYVRGREYLRLFDGWSVSFLTAQMLDSRMACMADHGISRCQADLPEGPEGEESISGG